MPTKTFFNLSSEKQDVLMKAAKKEFMVYPLQDVSINRIITEAKIPRGSFYMYFVDKEDLYTYSLERENTKGISIVTEIIKENRGNIFDVIESIYDKFSKYTLTTEYRNYFLNVMCSINATSRDKIIMKKPVVELNGVLETIDHTIFNCEEEYVQDIIDCLISYLIRILIQVFKGELTKEQGKEHISNFMKIIKYGAYKEEKDA